MMEARVSVVIETRRGRVRVTGVPARVCSGCGEQVYDFEVARRLEQLRDELDRGTLAPHPEHAGEVIYA